MRRLVGVGLVLLVLGACTSDRELVSSSLASRHYHAGRFLLTCCSQQTPHLGADGKPDGGTPTCAKVVDSDVCRTYGQAVDAQIDEVDLVNGASKLGRLPPSARTNLKDADKASEAAGKLVKKS